LLHYLFCSTLLSYKDITIPSVPATGKNRTQITIVKVAAAAAVMRLVFVAAFGTYGVLGVASMVTELGSGSTGFIATQAQD
jgi:hypothetical protein